MTIDDVRESLAAALKGGQLGTPCSLRARLQMAQPAADLLRSQEALATLAAPWLPAGVMTLYARRAAADQELSVLAVHERGPTVFLTAGRGAARGSTLDVLLVGNHGIARLEGADCLDADAWAEAVEATAVQHPEWWKAWRAAIEESLRTQQPVRCTLA